jgi:hypothetical protein
VHRDFRDAVAEQFGVARNCLSSNRDGAGAGARSLPQPPSGTRKGVYAMSQAGGRRFSDAASAWHSHGTRIAHCEAHVALRDGRRNFGPHRMAMPVASWPVTTRPIASVFLSQVSVSLRSLLDVPHPASRETRMPAADPLGSSFALPHLVYDRHNPGMALKGCELFQIVSQPDVWVSVPHAYHFRSLRQVAFHLQMKAWKRTVH